MKKDALMGRMDEHRSPNIWLNTVLPLFICLLFAVLIWLTAVNVAKADENTPQTQETQAITETVS